MSASVRISRKTATHLLELMVAAYPQARLWAVDDLRAALRVSPKKAAAKKAKRTKVGKTKAEKRDETAAIREAVMARAGGRCECGCGRHFEGAWAQRAELDHFWGRGKAPQSADNCWALSVVCHSAKTNGVPNRGFWLQLYRAHANDHQLDAEAAKATRLIAALELQAEAARVSGVGA